MTEYKSSGVPLSETAQMQVLKFFNDAIAPILDNIPVDIQAELLALAATERLFAMKNKDEAEKWRRILISMFEKLSFGDKRH